MYPLVKDQVYEVVERNGENICIEVDGIKYGYHKSHFLDIDVFIDPNESVFDINQRWIDHPWDIDKGERIKASGVMIVPIETDSIMDVINQILEVNNVNLQHRDLLWKLIFTSFERLYNQVVSSTDEYNDIVQSVLQSKSC